MFCADCGRPLPPDASFCGSCGNPVDGTLAGAGARPEGVRPGGPAERSGRAWVAAVLVAAALAAAGIGAAIAFVLLGPREEATHPSAPGVATPSAPVTGSVPGPAVLSDGAVSAGATDESSATPSPPESSEAERPLEPAQEQPALFTRFEGEEFAIAYPSGWEVETAEAPRAGYRDTTIRLPENERIMIRIDVHPRFDEGSAWRAAAELEALVGRLPDYRRLAFEPARFKGSVDAVRWEFLAREAGVLMHKVDVLFVDANGRGFAVLTQAPAGAFDAWSRAFATVRRSLVVRRSSTPTGEVES